MSVGIYRMFSALPLQASFVVIGGGIMGCSTLYHLAKLEVRVNRPIALAQVSRMLESGLQLEVDIAGKHFTATVNVESLYDAEGMRMKN